MLEVWCDTASVLIKLIHRSTKTYVDTASATYYCAFAVICCYAFATRRHYVFRLSVRPFGQIFTTIAYERLEQSWWNWQGITTIPTDDLVTFSRSKVKFTACRWGGEGIHVVAAASKSISLVDVLFFQLTVSSVQQKFNIATFLKFFISETYLYQVPVVENQHIFTGFLSFIHMLQKPPCCTQCVHLI